MKWQRIIGPLLVALGLLILALNLNLIRMPVQPPKTTPAPQAGAGKKAPAKQAPQAVPLKNRVREQVLRYVNTGKAYNPFGVAPLGLGAILLIWSFKRKHKGAASLPLSAAEATPVTPAKGKPSAPKRWHCCNVLQVGAEARQLWQFDARGSRFTLDREQRTPAGEPLPGHLVHKSWRALWQSKLNIAWLPAEHVFLRVAKLPQSSFEETVAMVELQLEKFSPLPVTQIVWSIYVMPSAAGALQTVVIIIAARNLVEEFLGQLEGQGYLADRLELPLLDQLHMTRITGDGAWIYPDRAAATPRALVAWWYGGSLQQLDLISLPAGVDRIGGLKEQLAQMTWGGELEGWLTAPPRWHLVADEAAAAEWQPLLREALGNPVETVAPLPVSELAAATAKRAASAPARVNLLPGEFALRYQQQFVDRLWMRGLGAVLSLYVAGVLVYFVALEFLLFRARTVENKVAAVGDSYTNVMVLKARYQILQDRQELKYAALDCWKATVETLPEGVTLEGLDFKDGKKLILKGNAPAAQAVLDFNEAMRKVKANDKPLLKKFGDLNYTVIPPNTVSWNFSCELNRVEAQ